LAFGICEERRETRVRGLFVIVHEPRMASHVGGHCRGQLASTPNSLLSTHGAKALNWD
jgi:hypothetical protein